ncbi:hypothetical protein [Rhodovulum sp. PH10]|uniref:hypothetical protein n=1 Tax=Rhodovulum sp. PH10 TaxID=1187851 RepID=UPI00058D8D48|nr:hypothetical protein [Rhodovulum sp. PH10]
MGTIVVFPDARQSWRHGQIRTTPGEPASIIILPVVRIARHEEPSDELDDGGTGTGRRRRRRRSAPQ